MKGSDSGSSESSEPTNYKSFREIYVATEEIELEDEELFLKGVD